MLRYRQCCCLPVTTSAFNTNFLIHIHINSFSYDSTVTNINAFSNSINRDFPF